MKINIKYLSIRNHMMSSFSNIWTYPYIQSILENYRQTFSYNR